MPPFGDVAADYQYPIPERKSLVRISGRWQLQMPKMRRHWNQVVITHPNSSVLRQTILKLWRRQNFPYSDRRFA